MTLFLLGCAALLLLSALFFLLPLRRGRFEDDGTEANLDWYRVRQEELAGEPDESLREDLQLRLLEDRQQGSAAAGSMAARGAFPLWVLPLFMLLFSVALYYRLGAAPDVVIARGLDALDENTSEQQMQRLMDSIRARSARRPGNLSYTALLGRLYLGQGDYARAAAFYGDLARAAPQDPQALAMAAQAEYLARNRELTPQAQMWAEQALAADPHQRTALGLLGMASYESGRYRAAIEYWERLLDMELPGSEGAQMIAGVIRSARSRLGDAAPAAGPADAAAPGPGVTVRVSFPAGADFAASDTVFVLARNALTDSRMPVAVQRLSAGQLPVTLRLDDSKSMAGQKLSELDAVMVLVQVSPDGRPGEANATWLGSLGPLEPSLDPQPRDIVLAPRG